MYNTVLILHDLLSLEIYGVSFYTLPYRLFSKRKHQGILSDISGFVALGFNVILDNYAGRYCKTKRTCTPAVSNHGHSWTCNLQTIMPKPLMYIFCTEARLGSCSQMHQQEEFGQIPDPFGKRDQDIKGDFWLH